VAVGEQPVAAGPAPSARVYFRTSRAELPEAAAATLAPIVAYLRQNAEAKAVVQGFHDPRGEQVPNRALARERAASVRAALLAEGIAEDRVLIDQPADPTGSGDYAEARRAEVTIRGE
jgi:outer membrane protein OmpA-like peptidoglycan-associated protein